MKKITIVQAAFNLGLKALVPGREPGVSKLPDTLQKHGFHKMIHPAEIINVEPPAYSIEIDPVSGVRNADAIVNYSKKLSAVIQGVINAGSFPLVIGGDCSILIGCAHALKSIGKYGLFFIDGHTDYMPVHLSATKAAAGMDLSIVTGNGHEKLIDIHHLTPYIQEEDALALGNRCYDKEYVEQIRNSTIDYVDLNDARKSGMPSIIDRFSKKINKNNCKGFWIHLDADVLDDGLMPCVDSRQPGGLRYAELKEVLQTLLHHKLVVGMNITILDPDLDTDGKYIKKFVLEMAPLFC